MSGIDRQLAVRAELKRRKAEGAYVHADAICLTYNSDLMARYAALTVADLADNLIDYTMPVRLVHSA